MTAEKAAVASAIASAVAALAAWAAVAQASRWQRRQREPWLHIQVSQMLGAARLIRVRIDNSGGGIAQEANFWVREGASAAIGGVPPRGSIAPGAGVTLDTALTPAGRSAEAVVTCRSGPRIHAWDAGGRHKSWRLNRWAFPKSGSNDRIVRRFYPQAPPVDELSLVLYDVVEQ